MTVSKKYLEFFFLWIFEKKMLETWQTSFFAWRLRYGASKNSCEWRLEINLLSDKWNTEDARLSCCFLGKNIEVNASSFLNSNILMHLKHFTWRKLLKFSREDTGKKLQNYFFTFWTFFIMTSRQFLWLNCFLAFFYLYFYISFIEYSLEFVLKQH